jgi:tetratricopeptide (TPR) repeat protein
LAAWIAVLLLAIYGILIGGSWIGIYEPHLRLVTMVLTGALLLGWLIVAWRIPESRPRSVMWPAIVASLGSLAISTATSRVPRVSLEYLGYAVVLAALYLWLVRLLANPDLRARLVAFTSMCFIALAGIFVGLIVLAWLDWWSALGHLAVPPLRPGFIGITYGNPSAALTIVALLAMPALATFAGWTRRGVVATMLILATVAIVALLSGSRAGWLALALTTLIVLLAWLAGPSNRVLARDFVARHAGTTPRRITVAVVGIGVAVLAVALAPPILQRVTGGGEEVRLTYQVIALRIFASAPLLGAGPGTWAVVRPEFTQPGELNDYVPYTHNLETQTLSDLGLLGAVAGLVLVANVLWLLRDGFRDSDRQRRRWAIVGTIGLLYFGLHQLLDVYANAPAILFTAVLPIAFLDATREAVPIARGKKLRWPAALGPAIAVAVLIAVPALTIQELPAIDASDAVVLANAGEWAAADPPARRAAAADPAMAPYAFTAGLTAARAGDHASAAAYFERVVQTDDVPEAWLNLAAERAALGQPDQALPAIERALRIGLRRPAVAMAAGELALRLGDEDLAVAAFVPALLMSPSLAADPWWAADPARAAALDRAAGEILATPDPAQWQIALMLGRTDEAKALAAGLSDPGLTLAVVAAWSGDAGALATLFAHCEAQPLDAGNLYWCARLAARVGDLARRDRYRFVASLTPAGTFDGGAEVRVSDHPMLGRSLAGNPAIFWGTYTYRRTTPFDVLVPSLVHLALE